MNQELTIPINDAALPFAPGVAIMPSHEHLKTVAAFLHGSSEDSIIVSATMTKAAGRAILEAVVFKVNTEDDFKTAGEQLAFLTRAKKNIEDRYLALGRPFRAAADEFRDKANTVLGPLGMAITALSRELSDFRALQELERQREIERQRIENEAKAKESRRIAEEKARLEAEAAKRQETAAAALDAATGDEAGFEIAAQAFDKGVIAADKAEDLVVPEAPIAHVTQAIPTLTKAKGVKFRKVARILTTDVTKLPAAYLIADTAKLQRHILDGVVTVNTPGVVFEIHEIAGGTGRGN